MAGRSGAAPKPADTLGVGDVLEAIRGVRWVARRPVSGGLPGTHRARTRGTAAEFTEYRVYRQGDEVRRLDWKLLARTDRAYVRLTEEQSVLPTTVVVDGSASMAYPEATRGKWVHAARLATGLAAVAQATGDPVGLRIAGGVALVPRMRRGVIGEVARILGDTTPHGSAVLAPLVSDLRGRVVIVSDFLGDAEAVIGAARAVRAQGGDVYAVHIVDAWELDPPSAAAMVTDPEAPHIRRPLVSAARVAYRSSFAEWRTALARDWRTAGAEYTLTVSGVGGESVPRALRRVVLGGVGDRHP